MPPRFSRTKVCKLDFQDWIVNLCTFRDQVVCLLKQKINLQNRNPYSSANPLRLVKVSGMDPDKSFPFNFLKSHMRPYFSIKQNFYASNWQWKLLFQKWEVQHYRFFRLESWPQLAGIEPWKWLFPRSRYCRFVNLEI